MSGEKTRGRGRFSKGTALRVPSCALREFQTKTEIARLRSQQGYQMGERRTVKPRFLKSLSKLRHGILFKRSVTTVKEIASQ